MSQANTVLIVDDDAFGRETLTALLQPHGYHLLYASSGPEALAQATARPPDLVLLDVMMPGMDGFEVCRRLRADPLLGEVPVIMLTALDDRESRLRGIEAGADDFVSKPFDRVELRSRVRTITRLNRYRRLLAERDRFEWVVEHADDGYLSVGEAGNLLYANAQARLYLGIAPDQSALGETFLELVSRQYQCEPPADWTTWLAQSADPAPLPRYLVRPASSSADRFILQVDLLEMVSYPGERHLIRLRDMTASIVSQNVVWSFQGLIRHKLGTSMAQLIGALGILEDLDLSSPTGMEAELFAIACRGAARLKADLHDIFQYIDAPDLIRPARDCCNLAELMSILSKISASLGLSAAQVGLAEIDDPGALRLALSREGVELILAELLENARKFHPQQSPAIEVALAHVSDNVHIHIRDDGQALSPEQLVKAWRPYYQGERFFTGQVAGMGLGLSMVAALIWRVGGSCRIYNRADGPGIGIELIVPLAEEPTDANVMCENREPPRGYPTENRG
jgi:DNA-binding response OmpR family regulator